MIPFTITDPARRNLGVYLCRFTGEGQTDLYDPVAKTWSPLTTFGHAVIAVNPLGQSTLYAGRIDESAIDATHENFLLACPAEGGEPIGSPAYIDPTPAPVNGQTVIINVGRPF